MNKINGYTEEEARSLVEYVCTQKKAGSTLSGIFESYAKKTGRAKGSVRNYYYALLRTSGDKRVKDLLSGTGLKAFRAGTTNLCSVCRTSTATF